MMTRAYDEIYLDDAMDTLGSAVEYAVLFCGLTGQEFLDLFIVSGIGAEFGRGNVTYISGMSGIELTRKVLQKCGIPTEVVPELPYVDYPPEYWVGWILAYFQWYTGAPFAVVCRNLRYETIFNAYGVLHEADPHKAVALFQQILARKSETNLARLRKERGLTQAQLARAAAVSLRSIQLYEQKKNDINKAQYNRLAALAAVLSCRVEDLLEYFSDETAASEL